MMEGCLSCDWAWRWLLWEPRRKHSTAFSLCNSPWRELRPASKSILCPSDSLICVARIAGIRDLERLCSRWGNELECVASNVNVRYRLLNLRHMAADALVTGRTRLVM